MAEAADFFKAPAAPSSETGSHVVFKMPPTKKLSDQAIMDSIEEPGKMPKQADPADCSSKSSSDGKESKKLVEEQTNQGVDTIYKPPVWSGPCTKATYYLDILKDGQIIGTVSLAAAGDNEEQTKPFYVFGRQGDVVVEHPSISRHHAVIQYRAVGDPHELGWYIYDLGSTHGSFLNKEKVPPFMHMPMRVGHMFKLGFSSRMYILNGPPDDMEPETGLSVTEIKQLAEKQKSLMEKRRDHVALPIKDNEGDNATEVKQSAVEDQAVGSAKDSGIDWGMSDDYDEEDEKNSDEDEGESAMDTIEEIQKREQLYIDDPKKSLKNFFDRQNAEDEMQFEYTERGAGSRHQWTCRIELPIESETGRPVFAEATISGNKKDVTTACALEACKILDGAGLLRNPNQEGRKRKAKQLAENDYYDSDEDTFLDRTGEVERKRAKRMRQAAELEADVNSGRKQSVDTYDTLVEKLNNVNSEMARAQQQIDLLRAEAAQEHSQGKGESPLASNKDSLDAYMATMSQQDSTEAKARQSRLRLKLIELKKTADRLEKLVRLTKPTSLPPKTVTKVLDSGCTSKKQLVVIGAMKGHRMRKFINPESTIKTTQERRQAGCDDNVEETEDMDEKADGDKTDKMPRNKTPGRDVKHILRMSTGGMAPGVKLSARMYTVPTPASEEECSVDEVNRDKPGPAGKDGDGEGTSEKTPKEQPHSRQRNRKNKSKAAAGADDFDGYDPSDINYAVWLPPDNQSGDGRTSLNEKFGY